MRNIIQRDLPMSQDPPVPATAAIPSVAPYPASAADFLSGQDEGRVFWRMRGRVVRAILRQVLTRARFRFALILVLSALLWAGLFWLFIDGFAFLKTAMTQPDMHDQTVRVVFGIFFASLWVMLLFSSGVIFYAALFRSPEIAFLLSTPARTERVFLHKFQEAVLFTSWGFVLLGSPMLLAYGIVTAAPWYYYVLLAPFIGGFVYIPVALGAIFCLLIMRHLPGNRVHVLIIAGILLVAGAAWIAWTLVTGPVNDLLTPGWFQEILARLQFTEGRLLPSWWLSTGLLEAARHVWSESVLFLALMISNALFWRQVALWIAARIYRPAYSAICGRHRWRRRTRPAWIDRLMFACLGFLPRPMRLLMVKDLRLFRRDPLQWSQFLVFFGLLALYFFNIRRFAYNLHYVGWVNMVSFLNLSVVGLLMSTFTTRFIFPMISLEGRRFWLLGLLPLKRETILWSKFLFAAGGSILPCSALILLSDYVLRVTPAILVSHQITCVLLCVGLSGIAVGLGARLPNLREQSPARIAAGFGGTLNLVVSTLYILVVVLLTALPYHFYLAAEQTPAVAALSATANVRWWLRLWLILGTCASVLIGVLATIIPLWIGFRAFRRLEF